MTEHAASEHTASERVEFDKSAELRRLGVAQRILEQSEESLRQAMLALEKDSNNERLQEQAEWAQRDADEAAAEYEKAEMALSNLDDAEKWANREEVGKVNF